MHAQKMEAIGRLAGGVAHDFNNLLGVIHGFGDMARRALPDDHPVQRRLDTMLKAAEKGAHLTRQLLAFARREPERATALDLNQVVTDMDSMLRRLIGEDVVLATHLAEGLPRIEGDAAQIEQILVNLVVNARDAMPQRGRLTIETGLEEASAESLLVDGTKVGRRVRLTVSDTGSGMDEATQARIFEPFFTTKAVGKGTGLGLSIVYGIVAQAGGSVRVDSSPGKGSRFHVLLPERSGGVATADVKPAPAPGERGGGETILVVEDDGDLCEIVAESLRGYGYKVLTAPGGPEALKLVTSFLGEIHVLLTDVVMPAMSGKDLAGQLRCTYPSLRVLFMSGYTDDTFERYELTLEHGSFIEKPFTAEQLARAVQSLARPAREEPTSDPAPQA
jgi:CheY-like chemotaxis protein